MPKIKMLAALALTAGAAVLLAADFWQSKPFTDWSEKELTKILTSSPWSGQVPLSMSGGGGGGGRGGEGGGGGMGGGGGRGGGGGGMGGGGGRGGGGGGMGGGAAGGGGGMPSRSVTVRWVSALPVKQALIKTKFGEEAGSADAKKMLEQAETEYVIAVIGLPGQMARANPERMQEQLKPATSLTPKGKDAIAPQKIEVHAQNGQAGIMFRFARTAAIDLDDKEVEFATKVGPMVIKHKFKLADMRVKGKLEL